MANAFKNIKIEPNTVPENNNDQKELTNYLKRQTLVKLPMFYGSPKDWPKFKKIFEDTTLEGRFSNMDNLNRLQQSLGGNAAKSVNHLMMHADNIDIIMRRLELNFGRPEIIYNELIADLSRIRKESKTAIIEISEALDSLVNNLEVINLQDYLRDPRLIDETISKNRKRR